MPAAGTGRWTGPTGPNGPGAVSRGRRSVTGVANAPVMSLELRRVQHELDQLCEVRLLGPLDPARAERFVELCHQERRLLATN